MGTDGSAADLGRRNDTGDDLGGIVRAGGRDCGRSGEGCGVPGGAGECGRGLGESCRSWLAARLAAGLDRPKTAAAAVAAIGPSALVVSVCRAAAVALIVYCGTLAVGLWWRISVAEARYAERQREQRQAEPPAAPPIERSSGRTEYAYRREEPYCGEEW